MTEQEAIKHLLDISSDMPSMECKYWIESIKLAIAALEKQITKKPNKKMMLCEGTYIGHCPTCNEGINSELLYCCTCGQKIDWEESE